MKDSTNEENLKIRKIEFTKLINREEKKFEPTAGFQTAYLS